MPNDDHHTADADRPDVVPCHWRNGGPITLASDTDPASEGLQIEPAGTVRLDQNILSLGRHVGREVRAGQSQRSCLNRPLRLDLAEPLL